jgi:pyridoxamine 5'-phosphate oxidase
VNELSAMRIDYRRGQLGDHVVAPTWLAQLQLWFDEAVADESIVEPNAIQVATVDRECQPSIRTVLVKAMDARGIVFYTNYDSDKGRDLAARPYAAAVFAWLRLERQVRLSGPVERVSRTETEAYFASRPRGSQLGAWASPQSAVVGSREELERRVDAFDAQFGESDIPPPPNWGGFILRPETVEFWQGRPNRLHDRVRFRQAGEGWLVERLAP